jgi:hypothetical protein
MEAAACGAGGFSVANIVFDALEALQLCHVCRTGCLWLDLVRLPEEKMRTSTFGARITIRYSLKPCWSWGI